MFTLLDQLADICHGCFVDVRQRGDWRTVARILA
jgi:hypothetical protein